MAAVVVMMGFTVGTWNSQSTDRASAGSDPLMAVENLIAVANDSFPSGDPTAFTNTFTEDGWFEAIDGGSFAVVGRAAMMNAFASEPDPDFSVTLISSEVDGDTVTGVVHATDADSVAAGVERYVQPFTAVVDGDLVASLRLRYDETDAQTATYLAYLDSLDDGNDDLPPGTVDIDMEGDQQGSVFVGDFDGQPFVILEIDPGADGVLQPAHIHTGTCDEPGPIVYPLASIKDGRSFTLQSASEDDLLTNDYIVNVHLSDAEIGTYVSCAALEAPAEEPTEEPTIELPDTGTGGDTGGSSLPWAFAALGIASLGVAGAAGALRLSAKRR